MDNKWLRLALVSFIGIVIVEFVVSMLGSFGGIGAGNPSVMMGTNMNMSTPMVPIGLADLHRQIIDVKTMISIGMPTAISLGLINLWRSFRK